MAVIEISSYPVLVELIHSGVPAGEITDEWGTYPYYTITSIHILNRIGQSLTLIATDEAGKTYSGTFGGFQDATINLPKPKQFVSAPLVYSISLT